MPFEGFGLVEYTRFGGLMTFPRPESVPIGWSPNLGNVRFKPGLVETRPGLTPRFSKTGVTFRGLRQFINNSGDKRLLTLDANGDLDKEFIDLVLGTILFEVRKRVANPGAMLKGVTAFGREMLAFYGGALSQPQGAIRQFDSNGNLDPFVPSGSGGGPTAADSVNVGSITAGTHKVSVLFETRLGYVSEASPPSEWIAAGSKKAIISQIPVGPRYVVARRLIFTPANSEDYYFVSTFRIPDNVSTSVEVEFTDGDLIQGDIANAFFNQFRLPDQAGVGMYNLRMTTWGGLNTAKLINLGFDGGFSVNGQPLGWKRGKDFSGGAGTSDKPTRPTTHTQLAGTTENPSFAFDEDLNTFAGFNGSSAANPPNGVVESRWTGFPAIKISGGKLVVRSAAIDFGGNTIKRLRYSLNAGGAFTNIIETVGWSGFANLIENATEFVITLPPGQLLSDVWVEARHNGFDVNGITLAVYDVRIEKEEAWLGEAWKLTGDGAALVRGEIWNTEAARELKRNIPYTVSVRAKKLTGTHTKGKLIVDLFTPTGPGSAPTAADSVNAGSIAAGVHKVAVLFETLDGALSVPSPTAQWTAAGAKKGNITNIPTGGAHVVARRLVFTPAGSNDFYYLASFRIPDNVTTSLEVDFTDAQLLDGTAANGLFGSVDSVGLVLAPSQVTIDYLEYTAELTAGLATIPETLTLRVMMQDTTAPESGQGYLVDHIQIYPTNEKFDASSLRVSDPEDAERFDGVNGFVTVSKDDGQKIIAAEQLRSFYYVFKERSMHVTVDDGFLPASLWPVILVDPTVGAASPNAVGVGPSFLAIASRSGPYIFSGGRPVWVGKEILPTWRRINWQAAQTIHTLVDAENYRIKFFVPLDAATEPGHALVLDFTEGFGTEEEAGGRKWSIDEYKRLLTARLEAHFQLQGTTTNPSNAIDANVSTFAELNSAVPFQATESVWQNFSAVSTAPGKLVIKSEAIHVGGGLNKRLRYSLDNGGSWVVVFETFQWPLQETVVLLPSGQALGNIRVEALHLGDSSGANPLRIYDIRLELAVPNAIRASAPIEDADSTQVILLAGSKIYNHDGDDDDGAPINSFYETAYARAKKGGQDLFGGVSLTVTGVGLLTGKLLGLQDTPQVPLQNISLSASPGKEFEQYNKLESERCRLRVEVNPIGVRFEAGDRFELTRAVIYARSWAEVRPM